jgi:hypothetical protein
MDLGPFSLRETTAWMQEVGQRRERLPKDRMRGEIKITCFNPLSPTLSLWEREEKACALLDGHISICP